MLRRRLPEGSRESSLWDGWLESLIIKDSSLIIKGLIAWSEPEFDCSPCPRWIAFILFYLGPNCGSFASSSQQLFTPLLSNGCTGEGRTMHNIALCTFIYWRFELFVMFPKLQFITGLTSVLRMYCKCSKNAKGEQKWYIQTSHCLQGVSPARQESEWNTHKPIFIIIIK